MYSKLGAKNELYRHATRVLVSHTSKRLTRNVVIHLQGLTAGPAGLSAEQRRAENASPPASLPAGFFLIPRQTAHQTFIFSG